MKYVACILSLLALSACAQLPVCPQVTISICPAQADVVAK
jgi:hypothetical protein